MRIDAQGDGAERDAGGDVRARVARRRAAAGGRGGDAAADVVLAPTIQSLSHTARAQGGERGRRQGRPLPGVTEEMLARVMSSRPRRSCGAAAGRSRVAQRRRRGAHHLRQRQRPAARPRGPASRSSTPANSATAAPSATCPAARASSPRSRGPAEGTLVVDGSIAGVGLLDDAGLADRPRGPPDRRRPAADGAALLELLTAHGADGTNVAELGIGTNEEAMLTGNILEDEKILGTAHVAFGASAAIGGTVQVPVHLDCVVLEPTVEVDGEPIVRERRAARLSRSRRCRPARRPQRLRGPRRRADRGPRGRLHGRRRGLLDRHTDADHDRTVFTLAGAGERGARDLVDALAAGAEAAIGDDRHAPPTRALHPAIGALDVCPVVWLDPADRDAAGRGAPARSPTQIGGLGVPVFLYGELASARAAPRARLLPQRRPGRALAADGGGELRPDLGPGRAAPDAPAPPWSPPARRSPPSTSSSTAATSRSPARSPPACASPAAGLPGVRAIGLPLGERPRPGLDQRPRPARGPAGRRRRAGPRAGRRRSAPARSRPSWSASLPEAALAGYPEDVPIRGFDPDAAPDRAAARGPPTD